MAKWFFANFRNSDIAIIIDPNEEESYVCASLAEEFEDLFEVKIDENGDFYMNFDLFSPDDQAKIEKDLTIYDDDDCQYDLCLGQDFLESNQVFDFNDDQLLIENFDGYEPLTINLFDYQF